MEPVDPIATLDGREPFARRVSAGHVRTDDGDRLAPGGLLHREADDLVVRQRREQEQLCVPAQPGAESVERVRLGIVFRAGPLPVGRSWGERRVGEQEVPGAVGVV